MTDAHHPPLNYEPSLTTTHPSTSSTLPPEVTQCLKNARFLHLATISATSNTNNSTTTTTSSLPTPHVSLMNYTFLPNYRSQNYPAIIMTTNARSLKTENLLHNPKVSLLVHDWVSHRPPTTAQQNYTRSGSPPAAATRSSLATLLLNMNTSALSSISTTIAGEARFLETGSEEEKWCKETHLANNTFGDQAREEQGLFGQAVHAPDEDREGANNASCYIEGDEVRVVIVPVTEGRIADWKGGVKDWRVVVDGAEEVVGGGRDEGVRGRPLVNGIVD